MKGTLTSYFIAIEGEVVQVTAPVDSGFLLNRIGFCATADAAGNPQGSEGSKLAGTPGHELAISAMDSKDDIDDYVMSVLGVGVDKRGDLDTVKAKALEALKDDDSGATA